MDTGEFMIFTMVGGAIVFTIVAPFAIIGVSVYKIVELFV
jgi:hypothetical protein